MIWLLALLAGVGAGYSIRGGSSEKENLAPAGNRTVGKMVAEAHWTEIKVERESLEELLANTSSTRLPRMTLWLLDASSEEIRELWRTLEEREELGEMKTYDMIMVHWTEKDPRAALAEVRGKRLENVAWWAWGRAHPEAAFEAALLEAPNQAANVLRSIGQFHVDLALQLMEKHPEAVAWSSVEGIGSGLSREDPRRAVEFLRSRGQSADDELERWAREDPESAFSWVKQNVSMHAAHDRKKFLRKLVMQHPENVEGWLKRLPTGMMQREMEMEYVGHLCETDLEEALAFARGSKGLRSRVEMIVEVGGRMNSHDPARAIELLGEMRQLIRELPEEQRENGTATGASKLDEWSNLLITVDPDGVMEMMEQISPEGEQSEVLDVMKQWVRRDEVAFADWLIEREPGTLRDQGAQKLSDQLLTGGVRSIDDRADYSSALDWASSIEEEITRQRQEQRVVREWMSRDPEGAQEYHENLPDDATSREVFDQLRTP